MNLEGLRQKRLKWVEANRENDFEDGIKRLLTDLYPDNAHFIYELLQNAEDAQATEVRFILQEDGVEFEHNGDRLFSIEDVEAITGIGITTKKDDHTNIGEFGVGFKAVFAYSSTPEIESGKYHFRIRDLVVPDTKELSPRALGENKTHFVFPFDNPQKSPEDACGEIGKSLRQLNEGTLLFLRNIRRIEYLLPDSTLGFLEREETDGNRIGISVQHPENVAPDSVQYLRFEKTVEVNDEDDGSRKPCRIAVAFGILADKEQQWKIKPLEQGQVCIYFPAEKETSKLRFHLHAPFASTVARDSVRDCPANDELRDYLATLVTESVIEIRDQRLLDVAFLATLPNNRDFLKPFYQPIQERLVEVFQNSKLTPMKRGDYAAASGIYRGSARLSDLINDDDLATILGEDSCPPMWIANPPQRNQREDNFLALLEIPEWKEEDLVGELSVQSESTTKWIDTKSDKWHQELYALLGDFLSSTPTTHRYGDLYSNRKEKLSNLTVVRLSDGTYEKGRGCYFPGDDLEPLGDFPRVAMGVYSSGTYKTQQKKARGFLEDIGVREVGEAERIEAILKKRYSKDSIEPHEQDMKRFIELFEKEPGQVESFEKYYIFELEHGDWGQPTHVFLDTPYLDTGLRAYYDALGEDSNQKWAVSPKYEERGIEPDRLAKFAKAVGAQTKLLPKKQEIPSEHPDWGSKLSDDGRRTHYGIDEDYNIPEFDILLDEPRLDKSTLIWKTMNQVPATCHKANYRSNRRSWTKEAHSTLVHQLKDAEWVPQKQKGDIKKYTFLKPADAAAELLPDGFVFKTGADWLEAVDFGKVKLEREERENLEKQRQSSEFQRQEEAAKVLDFESPEDALEAKELLDLKREDPEGFDAWQERKMKPQFPVQESQNPEHRKDKVSQGHAGSPEKGYEKCMRSVRVTEATAFTRTWLKNQYTNEEGQMICQICQKEMPFRKRDGEYYFEAVEALSRDYFSKEHEGQFLALCPECAARYKEFIKHEETAMQKVYNEIKSSELPEVPMQLGELESSIRFVETHWSDMKTILQAQTESDDSVVDRSDAWSEQDQEDLTSASLHYAETLYPEDEDLV